MNEIEGIEYEFTDGVSQKCGWGKYQDMKSEEIIELSTKDEFEREWMDMETEIGW